MMRRRILVILGVLSLAGCGRLAEGARQYFIAKYTCPAERVTLAKMRDVKATEIFAADWHANTPPDEVRNDPGRLAQWKAGEDERCKNWEWWINSSRLFKLSGCGHSLILACWKPGQQSSPSETASCEEAPARTAG